MSSWVAETVQSMRESQVLAQKFSDTFEGIEAGHALLCGSGAGGDGSVTPRLIGALKRKDFLSDLLLLGRLLAGVCLVLAIQLHCGLQHHVSAVFPGTGGGPVS